MLAYVRAGSLQMGHGLSLVNVLVLLLGVCVSDLDGWDVAPIAWCEFNGGQGADIPTVVGWDSVRINSIVSVRDCSGVFSG